MCRSKQSRVVPTAGLEPAQDNLLAPQASASTNSATSAINLDSMKPENKNHGAVPGGAAGAGAGAGTTAGSAVVTAGAGAAGTTAGTLDGT